MENIHEKSPKNEHETKVRVLVFQSLIPHSNHEDIIKSNYFNKPYIITEGNQIQMPSSFFFFFFLHTLFLLVLKRTGGRDRNINEPKPV